MEIDPDKHCSSTTQAKVVHKPAFYLSGNIYRISVQVLALSPHLSEQLLRECVHFEFSPSGVGCLVLLGYKLIWQEAPGFLEFS